MPIRPEDRGKYPPDWRAISKRIREERARNRCEQCGAPNGRAIARGSDGTYMLEDGQVFDAETGEPRGYARGSEYPSVRWVRVVLTVAHLDHDPTNSADENLRALCQRCHLAHDRGHHVRRTRETRERKSGQGRLF